MDNKAAYIACMVVISIGLMVFTSVSLVIQNLELAKERFYKEYRFADGFARVKGMPYLEIARLAKIEGIEQIEGRLVKDVRVLFPNQDDNVYLTLVSYQPEKSNLINNVKLIDGRPLEDETKSILINAEFVKANQLAFGDQIPILVEGKKIDLTLVGTGQSPEFIIINFSQDQLPSAETYGVGYIPYNVMKNLFREKGLVNDIVFTIKPGYSYQDIEDQLKPKLEKYGLESMYPRKDQMSHVLLTQELVGLRATANTLPVVFLVVAAAILYIMLKRLVEQQRGQIGTLKAFGYSDRQILYHYLTYALLIGISGGLSGGLLGIWLSFPMIDMYKQFFNLPDLKSQFSFSFLLFGILLSIGFSLFAGYNGSKQALRLQPAEAMRPPAPISAKKTWIEQVNWYWESLTVQGKMATRNLFRNKQRSFFTFIGVMFSFSLMATLWYFQETTNLIMLQQFEKVQTYNVKMSFNPPVAIEGMERELKGFPGMKKVEPMLEVPVTFKHKWHKKDVSIIGLKEDSQLYNILNRQGDKVAVPSHGILLSERLAQLLDVQTGSTITLESIWTEKTTKTLEVTGIIPQYLGINAYMQLEALHDFLGEGEMASSALIYMEVENIPSLKDQYQEAKMVTSIDEKNQLLAKYYEMLDSYSFIIWIMVLFALIAGFSIIYNSSIISLSERKRELASLRVLGMTPKEVLQVIIFEQWFISFFAILAAIPLTFSMIKGLAQSMDNDIYIIPVLFEPFSFIYAFIGTIIALLISQWTLSKKIHQLSLVDVLKEKD
ncbi:FtsX-like permease family protein [Microaerobacter geothermalis]|nr:FtsX-like permease family protein [Microaerobacter geothermalis]